MCYLRPQDEIKSIMLRNGIGYQWVADMLGTYYQKIQYYVESSKGDDNKLYTDIMILFEKHGFSASSQNKCQSLIALSFKSNAVMANEIRRFNNEVANNIQDGSWTPDERLKMRVRLEDTKSLFIQTFDELIKLTEDIEP